MTMNPEKKETNYRTIGLALGLLLSYPISYFFQPEALRMKLTMSGYISHIGDVLRTSELRSAVLVCLVLCPLIGSGIGYAIDKNARKVD